jgi:hypothetical protein
MEDENIYIFVGTSTTPAPATRATIRFACVLLVCFLTRMGGLLRTDVGELTRTGRSSVQRGCTTSRWTFPRFGFVSHHESLSLCFFVEFRERFLLLLVRSVLVSFLSSYLRSSSSSVVNLHVRVLLLLLLLLLPLLLLLRLLLLLLGEEESGDEFLRRPHLVAAQVAF